MPVVLKIARRETRATRIEREHRDRERDLEANQLMIGAVAAMIEEDESSSRETALRAERTPTVVAANKNDPDKRKAAGMAPSNSGEGSKECGSSET